MRVFASILTALAITALAPGAQAQQCGPLRRALSMDLAPVGIYFGVPVMVNGTQRSFALATSAGTSNLARKVVEELKLTQRPAGRSFYLSGNITNAFTTMVDLGVAGQTLKDQEMWIAEGTSSFDGTFAPDLMQHYDIEIDFAGRKLNYFLTDHCEGKVVYWPAPGFVTVPLRGWSDYSVYPTSIPVSIDGHQVLATVNSAIPTTTLDADTAHQLFNLTADSPGTVPMGTLDGNLSHRSYGYTFKTLSIGGLSFSNPRIQVIPDLIGSKGTETVMADSHIVRYTQNALPTVRLGMDVLRRLHLYVAAKEQKLYITPAADQAAGGGAASTPAAGKP